jgi:hypothetical protein
MRGLSLVFYLRNPEPRTRGVNVDPLGERLGARVLPEAFRIIFGLVIGAIDAVGPVLLHVGTTFDEPTDGATYEPTDGATVDPYPESPGACASANVLVRVKAVASAIVVSFMLLSFLVV